MNGKCPKVSKTSSLERTRNRLWDSLDAEKISS